MDSHDGKYPFVYGRPQTSLRNPVVGPDPYKGNPWLRNKAGWFGWAPVFHREGPHALLSGGLDKMRNVPQAFLDLLIDECPTDTYGYVESPELVKLTSEYTLLCSVLLQAAKDTSFEKLPSSQKEALLEWIVDDSSDPFSLVYICNHIGISPTRARDTLLRSFAGLEPLHLYGVRTRAAANGRKRKKKRV